MFHSFTLALRPTSPWSERRYRVVTAQYEVRKILEDRKRCQQAGLRSACGLATERVTLSADPRVDQGRKSHSLKKNHRCESHHSRPSQV